MKSAAINDWPILTATGGMSVIIFLAVVLSSAIFAMDSRKSNPRKQGSSGVAEPGTNTRLLNVILFESYMTPSVKEGSAFDRIDWPNSDFPKIFSKLIALSGPQNVSVPSTFDFPKNPIFIDIYSFALNNIRIDRKKNFSRINDITAIRYKIAVTLHSNGRYEVSLEGRHEDFKFRDMAIEARNEGTEIIRIRKSPNRTLYIALSFMPSVSEAEHGLIRPKLLSQPWPPYPAQLIEFKWAGSVRILCVISSEGKIDPQNYILLECPHTLFARSSLDAILNKWKFAPASKSGIAISYRTVIDVPFLQFSSKIILQMPRDSARVPFP